MIKIKNLTVSFGEGKDTFVAVKNANFVVEPKQMFGLVGESGSGKSTILKAITGLHNQYQGEIFIENKSLGHKRDKAFYKNVQMVFQDPYASLHPRHSINTILSEPLIIHGVKNIDEKIKQVLLDVHLDEKFRFRYPHQLSGGQRQRVAVARALLLEPKVLLLDEPTSALDVSIQAEILNLLMEIREKMDLTCIFVSHDLAVIAHMCDQIAVMQHGEIVEQLSVQDLTMRKASKAYTQKLITASDGYVPR